MFRPSSGFSLFAYRTTVDIGTLALSVVLVAAVALATVATKVVKAASASPAASLRRE